MTVRRLSAVDVANRSVVNPGKAQVYDVRQLSQQLISAREVIFGSGTGIPEANIKITGTPAAQWTFYAEQYDIDSGGEFFVIGRKYKVYKFTTIGSIQANSATARFFVSGAGGGGGAVSGGGGGAGELIALTGDINNKVSWTIGAGSRDSKLYGEWYRQHGGYATQLSSLLPFPAKYSAPSYDTAGNLITPTTTSTNYALALGGNPGMTLLGGDGSFEDATYYFSQHTNGDRYRGCGGGGAATTSTTDQKGMSIALGEPAREADTQVRVAEPIVKDWYIASGSAGGNGNYGVTSMSTPPTGWRSAGAGGGCGIFDFYPATGGTWGPKANLINMKNGGDATWRSAFNFVYTYFFSYNLVNNQGWNFGSYINDESQSGSGGLGWLPSQINNPDFKSIFDGNSTNLSISYNRGGVGFNGYGRNSIDSNSNNLPYSSSGNAKILTAYDANGTLTGKQYGLLTSGSDGGYYGWSSAGAPMTVHAQTTLWQGILDGAAGYGNGGGGTGGHIPGNITLTSRGGSGYVIICVEIK